jgi:hypothetical protein
MVLEIQPAPRAVDPEATDNTLLRFVVSPGVEVLEARLRVVGQQHTANLADGASVSASQALIDLGGLRPVTRVNFTRSGSPSKLMIQVGGSWFLPAPAGGVSRFDDYAPNTPFPELLTEKALLSNVASVSVVESVTFPSNVALRLRDGGVPFFFLRGSLRASGADVPDFAQHLNLAVRTCEPIDGACVIDLIAHSDTFGTIGGSQVSVAFREVHDILASMSPEARTLIVPAAGGASIALPLPLGLRVPFGRPPVAAVSLALAATGFGPAFAPTPPRRGAIVSPSFQVAQAVDIPTSQTVAGIHLQLLPRRNGTLTVELHRDASGEPRGALLATASAPLTSLPEAPFSTVKTSFDPPLALTRGERVWVVLRSDDADVEWAGDDVPPAGQPALFSQDRGNAWQPHPLTTSYAFEVALPNPFAFTVSVGGQDQSVGLSPVTLDATTPLVHGLNRVLTDGRDLGSPLPAQVELQLTADPPLHLAVILATLDITLTQTVTA